MILKKNIQALSNDRYRESIHKMNISFCKLGHEDREHHQHDNEDLGKCSLCKSWKDHVERGRMSRNKYEKDKEGSHGDQKSFFC